MGLFRRKAAKGMTEAQMDVAIGPAVEALTRNLRAGEEIIAESVVLAYPQAVDPSTGEWHEGPLNLAAVTNQVLCISDPTTGQRNVEYDILGLSWYKIRPEDASMMVQFYGLNKDLVQVIVLRLAGPTDWPGPFRSTLLSGLAGALTDTREKHTGQSWDFVGMEESVRAADGPR